MHRIRSLVLGLLAVSSAGANTETGLGGVYFGCGCFWARQHSIINDVERALFKRGDAELTAVAAYAGGADQHDDSQLCYENPNNTAVYSEVGAAEVVSLVVEDDAALQAAATVFFGLFEQIAPDIWARPDYMDIGAAYRALLGVPGGLDGAYGTAIVAANVAVHNMTLVEGTGSDPDTIGTNTVFVMDSDVFPAVQAEVCLQFHDDASAKYSEAYHGLVGSLLESGRLHDTDCPANLISGCSEAD